MENGKDLQISQEYKNSVSVIIPAYNEEKRITYVLKDILKLISANPYHFPLYLNGKQLYVFKH